MYQVMRRRTTRSIKPEPGTHDTKLPPNAVITSVTWRDDETIKVHAEYNAEDDARVCVPRYLLVVEDNEDFELPVNCRFIGSVAAIIPGSGYATRHVYALEG